MKTLKKLTILHSNDMHGDFLAEEIDDTLVGGVSMLSGYVSRVRKEEKNTIYCIAGDMFRGSVIDSEFQGISTIEIMNMISPDVVTLGNHETDYGIAHLLFIEKCAKFPIINANLHIKTNGARLFKSHHIAEIDGMKILFIGILTEDVLSQTKNDGIIGAIVDTYDATEEIGRICNAYNAIDIDFTVLLTHIGFEEDKLLAARLDPAWGVDVIIGGHSHTTIEEPAVVNDILIVQAGVGTDQIGRFDIMVDTDNNCVDSYTWQSIPINENTCPRDESLDRIIGFFTSKMDTKYSRLVTRLKGTLTHPSRIGESSIGNLFADIMKESLGLDLMLLASGSIRSESFGPIVLYSDLCECFPYDEYIYMVKVTGSQLRRMLKYMLRDEALGGSHSEFYQLSQGMHVVYDRAERDFDVFEFDGAEIAADKIFKIGLQKYHYLNFSNFFNVPIEEVSENEPPRVVSTSCRTILDEYLSSHQNLEREAEGRIIIL